MTAGQFNPRFKPVLAAAVCGILVALASLAGSLSMDPHWYNGLDHPAGTPPDATFPIVWTLLYILMAVAAWRVWRARGLGLQMGLFVIQLLINALWMPVAFGAHALVWAILVALVLWLAVAATLQQFWQVDRLAGALFGLYLLWATYALYLSIGLAWLN